MESVFLAQSERLNFKRIEYNVNMDMDGEKEKENNYRRKYGIHLTSKELFRTYLFPDIKDILTNFIWVDLFAGEGNLILPILSHVKKEQRVDFFKNHIYLFDIQEDMIKQSIHNAGLYGIPEAIAEKNIKKRDNLLNFPSFLLTQDLPIYHITNPPYLYLGYIKKHHETKAYFKYFDGENEGYQDLYQIAMMNDLRNGVENLIYIIPSNFLFGSSVSNKFRVNFLKHYFVLKMFIFELKVFEFTGTNICIGYFHRKNKPLEEIQEFPGIKFKKQNLILERNYKLNPKYKYRCGSEFNEFIESYRRKNALEVSFYLKKDEVMRNVGDSKLKVIDANNYKNNKYNQVSIAVNEDLSSKIKSNFLYVRTVDTGSEDGKAGLGMIHKDYSVDGILVSGNPYRTHPIQIFLNPQLSSGKLRILKDYVNLMLNFYRNKLDSEFLTTYKYSNANYTRKYLGLTQIKGIIQTFPFDLLKVNQNKLKDLILEKRIEGLLELLKKI